jgi:hypothetical protein
MNTKIESMAVTVTLIFSDEVHREAWLLEEGILAAELPAKNEAREYPLPSPLQPQARKLLARRIDYEKRRGNTDLQYCMGPIHTRKA